MLQSHCTGSMTAGTVFSWVYPARRSTVSSAPGSARAIAYITKSSTQPPRPVMLKSIREASIPAISVFREVLRSTAYPLARARQNAAALGDRPFRGGRVKAPESSGTPSAMGKGSWRDRCRGHNPLNEQCLLAIQQRSSHEVSLGQENAPDP